jgi:hypothetical protein
VEALYIEMGEVRKVGGVRDSLARHVTEIMHHSEYVRLLERTKRGQTHVHAIWLLMTD